MNGYAARPASSGLARYFELTLTCAGIPDPRTGYLVDIHVIDELVRAELIPIITDACTTNPGTGPASWMPELWERAKSSLGFELVDLSWSLTPHTRISMHNDTPLDLITIRQSFEFSASHRLHSEHLDEETNRRTFGKCNNPNGHGHNYRVEPAIVVPIGACASGAASIHAIDELVERILIDQLDHKHLNEDCPAFNQSSGGVIPSVENIARFCYEQLEPNIINLDPDARLARVTVWETDRTSCTYPAGHP